MGGTVVEGHEMWTKQNILERGGRSNIVLDVRPAREALKFATVGACAKKKLEVARGSVLTFSPSFSIFCQ
jgi:hypothetical protein